MCVLCVHVSNDKNQNDEYELVCDKHTYRQTKLKMLRYIEPKKAHIQLKGKDTHMESNFSMVRIKKV